MAKLQLVSIFEVVHICVLWYSYRTLISWCCWDLIVQSRDNISGVRRASVKEAPSHSYSCQQSTWLPEVHPWRCCLQRWRQEGLISQRWCRQRMIYLLLGLRDLRLNLTKWVFCKYYELVNKFAKLRRCISWLRSVWTSFCRVLISISYILGIIPNLDLKLMVPISNSCYSSRSQFLFYLHFMRNRTTFIILLEEISQHRGPAKLGYLNLAK